MHWRISLTSGDVIVIFADATFVEGEDRVFEVATGSRPPQLIQVARVPMRIISDYLSIASAITDDPGTAPSTNSG